MNNIKALPGCLRGSRQLGQTLVTIIILSFQSLSHMVTQSRALYHQVMISSHIQYIPLSKYSLKDPPTAITTSYGKER